MASGEEVWLFGEMHAAVFVAAAVSAKAARDGFQLTGQKRTPLP